MNLVAKEYVAARVDLGGALVLSEFAGAAGELRQAFLCNPHDLQGVKDALLRAVRVDSADAARRMRTMRRHLRAHDVKHWASAFLSALGAPGAGLVGRGGGAAGGGAGYGPAAASGPAAAHRPAGGHGEAGSAGYRAADSAGHRDGDSAGHRDADSAGYRDADSGGHGGAHGGGYGDGSGDWRAGGGLPPFGGPAGDGGPADNAGPVTLGGGWATQAAPGATPGGALDTPAGRMDPASAAAPRQD
jgi:hypothetical protein